MSEDPIADDADNLYRYVGNNAPNLTDPSGMGAVNSGRTAAPAGNWGVGGILRGLRQSFIDPISRQMGAISEAGGAAYARWGALNDATRGQYRGPDHYAAAHVNSILPSAMVPWWSDHVIEPAIQNSSEAVAIRAANAASYADWAKWNTGFGGFLNAAWKIYQGADEGAQAGVLANAKAWTFGLSDTVNSAYDVAWDKGGLRNTWAETGSNITAAISRDAFIGAFGGYGARTFQARGSAAWGYAARGVQLYDYGSGAVDVVQGVNQVRQGNNWGWVQIAGGGLSAFNAGDIGLRIDDASSLGSFGRPMRPGGYRVGDVTQHAELSPAANRALGFANTRADGFVQSHHFIQDAWARKNVKGYSSTAAPSMLQKSAAGQPHALISGAQRARRNAPGWGGDIRREFQIAYREALTAGIDVATVTRAARQAYKYFDSIGAFR